jgi:hypothetical protein
MDNSCAIKILGLGVARVMLLNAQSSPNPADLLEQARDKVIARLPPLGYSCIATINRSYFRLQTPPDTPKSCEEISADRKKSRTELQLAKTDRLRLQVVLTSAGEIYSWTGLGGFSRDVEEVIHSGDIGTGGLGARLDAIFANPLVRFRLLGQTGKDLEFGFRVPVEASSSLVKAGVQWRKTGYGGSLAIDPASLEIKRLTIETEELPAETSMCESSTTLEYPPGSTGVLLPSTVRTRDLNRDTTETEWVTTFSDCREAPEKTPERPRAPLFPPTWAVPFKLVLAVPIDTSTVAAGDVITARLAEAMLGPPSSKMWAPAGSTLTGRIMRIEHYLRKLDYTDAKAHAVHTGRRYFFLIWVDFDTIEANGVVSSIRARLTCGESFDANHHCPFAIMSDQKWDRALTFDTDSPNVNVVVPAGYTSTWLTGDPPSK